MVEKDRFENEKFEKHRELNWSSLISHKFFKFKFPAIFFRQGAKLAELRIFELNTEIFENKLKPKKLTNFIKLTD